MTDQNAQLLGLHTRTAGEAMLAARDALAKLDPKQRKAVLAAVRTQSTKPIQRHMRTYRVELARTLGVADPDHPDSL